MNIVEQPGIDDSNVDTEERKAIHSELRPATDDDMDFVRNAYKITYESVMKEQYGSWAQEAQESDFETVWEDGPIQIITVDAKPCGFIQTEERDAALWLDELVLLPEAQGRGIGSTLIRNLQAEATAKGLPMRLNVLHANSDAYRLYEHLGFQVIGEQPDWTEMEWTPENVLG